MRISLSLAAFVVASSPLGLGQDLVKNINEQPLPTTGFPFDGLPAEFTEVGGRLYFSAQGAGLGRELYYVEAGGTGVQLLIDLAPGTASSDPGDVIALPSGDIVFTAWTPTTGREWYVSDGTAAGTVLLPEMVGGAFDGFINAATLHQGEVYFVAADQGTPTRALWKTDGTAAGTVRLEHLDAINGFASDGEVMASAGSTLYYSFHGFGTSGAFWILAATNGTVGGATQVIEVLEPTPKGIRDLTAAGSNLVFAANATGIGTEPWVSDGTQFGTWPVNLMSGSASSNPSDFVEFAGEVFFVAQDASEGREIFRSDGTTAGTQLVTTAHPGTGADGPTDLTVALGQLLFTVDTPAFGVELWSTDGSFGAEGLFADIVPGPGSGNPQGAIEFGGRVLCGATAGVGVELYATDGTPAGTELVADINPDGSSNPTEITAFGGRVYFAAQEPSTGVELWTSDGTGAGTFLFAELAPVATDQDSTIRALTSLGDRFAFIANDGVNSWEPWISDGSEPGTQLITAIDADNQGPFSLAEYRGLAWISRTDNSGIPSSSSELWVSDGTATGTGPFPTAQYIDDPGRFTVWRDRLYFVASGTAGAFNDQVYVTDGTPLGTVELANPGIDHGVGVQPILYTTDDFILYRAFSDGLGQELWRTDGTPAGTELVKDVWPGPGSGLDAAFFNFYAAATDEGLYFVAQSSSGDGEPWFSDGTSAGTYQLADINPGGGSDPRGFTAVGDRMFFHALVDGLRQVFVSDGVGVEQLTFSETLYIPADAMAFGNDETFFLFALDPIESPMLIASDGTVAGTETLVEFEGNFGTQYLLDTSWKLTSGEHVLFTGYDDTFGVEYWVTDGTEVGTYRLTDSAPASLGASQSLSMTRVGGVLYFNQRDEFFGYELFSLPIAAFGGWVAETFGIGCAGASGSSPTIEASGRAAIGEVMTVEIEDAAPFAPLAYYFSLDFTLGNVGGCQTYLAAPALLALGATDVLGHAQLPLAIPNDVALAGLELWLQTFVADPGGSLSGAGALTSALEVIIAG